MYPQNSKMLKIIMKRHPPGCCHTSTLLRCLHPLLTTMGSDSGALTTGSFCRPFSHTGLSWVTFSDCTGYTSPELDLDTKSPELDLGTKS